MNKRMLVALLCLAAMTGASATEIRKTVAADGKVTISNVPLKPAAAVATASVEPGAELLRPDVIGAVANVMGVAHLVSSSRTFCVAAAPTAYKRYSSAADAWLQRNAAVVAQKERLMSAGEQRLVANALSGDMVRQTEELMRPIRSSGNAEKIAWCNKAFADVDRGALDLIGRASIAPLMRYKIAK
jgi:hypothetical protein